MLVLLFISTHCELVLENQAYKRKAGLISDSTVITSTDDDIESNYALSWREEYQGWDIKQKPGKCPTEIILPGQYSNGTHSGPVVEVKENGFSMCGLSQGQTESIFIPKEIRFLRSGCFFCSYFVTHFEIEDGSQLEEIEYTSLHFVGYKASDSIKRTTLYLPSTIKNIAEQGIYRCYIFDKIVYCGWRILPNSNHWIDNSINGWTAPEFYVTYGYPLDTMIFSNQVPIWKVKYDRQECSNSTFLPNTVSRFDFDVDVSFSFIAVAILTEMILTSDN